MFENNPLAGRGPARGHGPMSSHHRRVPVTLKQLRALLAVAQTNSFTQAAEQLSITQSAMSGLIREFENIVDVRLVDRDSRHVALSRAGQSVQPMLAQIVEDLDRVLSELADLKHRQGGLVRIAATPLVACAVLPEFIARHARRHPQVSVRIVDCAADDILPRLIAGEAEFGIAPERDGGSLLSACTLFEMPLAVVLPSDHPLARHREIRWSDLLAYPIIAASGEPIERLAADVYEAHTPNVPDMPPTLEVANVSTALGMVHSGLGVMVCMPCVAPHLPHRLAMRPLREPVVERRYGLFVHRGAKHSPAAESVAREIVGFCSSRWSPEPIDTARVESVPCFR